MRIKKTFVVVFFGMLMIVCMSAFANSAKFVTGELAYPSDMDLHVDNDGRVYAISNQSIGNAQGLSTEMVSTRSDYKKGLYDVSFKSANFYRQIVDGRVYFGLIAKYDSSQGEVDLIGHFLVPGAVSSASTDAPVTKWGEPLHFSVYYAPYEPSFNSTKRIDR